MAATQIILEQLASMEEEERQDLMEVLISVVDDEEEQLDAEQLAQLQASIARGEEDIKANRVHDANDVLRELRARHPQ
jgi:hypothetical protein